MCPTSSFYFPEFILTHIFCIRTPTPTATSLNQQKYFYRYSKLRGKADYFEGRDDSGVVSSRFFEEAGSGPEYTAFFQEEYPDSEAADHTRLLDNCLAMGSHKRPSAEKGTFWYDWYGLNKAGSTTMDRCRLLITLNMVGAGRGSTT